MSTLERLSDARGTVEGKIVAIVLAVLLVMPVVGVTAFADSEADHDHGTPAADVVETSVVKELPDTGNQPISEVAEPEQPAAPTVVPEEEPAEEPADADEVRLGLDVDEGAALVYDGKAYGVADGYFVVPAGQDATFTVRLDEGVALADDEPVVLKAADGSKDELVAVDGIYTIQAGQLAEGLTVAVAVAGVEGDAAADEAVASDETAVAVEEDTWEYPASVQTINAKAWCTSEPLGNQSFNTDGTALGSEAGMSLDELASPSASKDGKQYFFHHAQLPTKAMEQLDKDKLSELAGQHIKPVYEEYDPAKAIMALRYNESAGSWQYKANGAWHSFDVNEHQLELYYNQLLNIGDNVTINAKDWPWTEAEWLAGKGTPSDPNSSCNRACVIYQVYDAAGNKMGDQFLTYYYSPNVDKSGLILQIAQYWKIQEVCVKPMVGAEKPQPPVSYKGKVSSPGTYDELLQRDGGYATDTVDSFTIPFESMGEKQHNVWMVGLKIEALPSEQTLTVEYLDDADGSAIQGALSVVAKNANGTAVPTWGDYVRIDNGKLAGDPDSTEVTTNIGDSAKVAVPFTIEKANYTNRHVRAELDGNTLKLYFAKVYGVSYEWSGLDLDGVDEVVGPNGQKVAGLPHDDGKYLVGAEYQVSAVHKAGDVAYVVKDGKVAAVYRFSGWKLNGDLAEGIQTMLEGGVTLVGTWEALTANYKGTVSVEGQVYDGTSDYTKTLKTTLTDPANPGKNPEPSRYIYKDKDGKKLDSAPVDAGDYTVTAVWDATDTRPEVVSDPCDFTISKRPVVLKSASATKVFDGKPLTKHEMVDVKESDDNLGFIDGQGVDITYKSEITNPGTTINNEFTYAAQGDTNLNNYAIRTDFGTLKVTDRDAKSKIKVTLVAASKGPLTYDGTEQSVAGLERVDAVMDGDSYVGSEQEGVAVITINGATFKVSGYKTGAAATNAGSWNHNIVAKNGFIVLDAVGNNVTDQFAIETVAGTLKINPRSVTLTSGSATKYYDGTALTKPGVTVSNDDAVFTREAMAKATGWVTNVAEGEVTNVISVAARDAAEGVNEFNQANYDIAYSYGKLKVLPQTIDPEDKTTLVDPEDPDNPDKRYKGAKVGNLENRVYNGQADDQKPVVTDINGNSLNPEADYTLTADKDRTNVRTVTITVTGTGNYTGTVKRTYEITPAPVKVIVDNAAKKYGEDDPAFTGTIDKLFTNDLNGNAMDELGTIAYSRTNSDEAVGTYKDVLTAKVTNRNPNYQEPEVVLGTFTITDADAADISAKDVTKTFDGQPASIEASTEDGWTLQYSIDEGDDKTWSTENPSFVDAGTYKVYVKATRSGHADAGPVSATVIINPAPITITVADASKVAGTDDPVFRGTIEGEVAGYPLSGVNYFRSNDDEGVGVYVDVLTATYDDNPNYAVTIDPGTFTITAMALPDNPPTPGPIDTIIDFLSTPIIGGTPGTDGPMVNIADDGTPLANIDDNDTPLAAFDHPLCWVHYYILLGIIITAIYGGGVIARRLNYNRKVKGYEDDVTGKSRDGEEAKRPVAVPTQA